MTTTSLQTLFVTTTATALAAPTAEGRSGRIHIEGTVASDGKATTRSPSACPALATATATPSGAAPTTTRSSEPEAPKPSSAPTAARATTPSRMAAPALPSPPADRFHLDAPPRLM